MKIILNRANLHIMMSRRNIDTYKQLADYCGVNYNTLRSSWSVEQLSLKTAYLLADGLGCKIEDLIYVDWEHD